MKSMSYWILVYFILFATTGYSQIRNINSIKGAWQGQWINNYYQSSGSISASFTVNTSTQTGHGEWNVGGNILGQPRAPFATDLTLNETGFSANFNSPIWGDIAGTGLNSGAYSGSANNCPNPNATNIIAVGTFTPLAINGTFSFTWYGTPITGSVTMTKLNPISDPTNLTVTENPIGTVELHWTDNATNETGYRVERKLSAGTSWTQIGTVAANVTTYSDTGLPPETQYIYRIAAYSESTESEFSDEVSISTAVVKVDNNLLIPSDYLLLQNYPNPFNPATIIHYALPRQSHVTIAIYSILGEYITTLADETKSAGSYDVKFDGSKMASGIYLIKMVAQSSLSGNRFIDCRKMVLLK